jgi:hypothetical protein
MRVTLMVPADDQPDAHAGSPEMEKALDVETPWALTTTAVTEGVTPVTAHEGAVHTTWLVVAVVCAAPSEPVLAVHVNVMALDWGSRAVTSKPTVCSGVVERADW